MGDESGVGKDGERGRDFVDDCDHAFRGDGAQIDDEALDERPELEPAALRSEGTASGRGLHAGLEDSLDEGFHALEIAPEYLEDFARPGEGAGIEGLAEFLDEQRHCIERSAQVVGEKGEVFVFLRLAFQRLLGGKSHHGEAHGVVDPQINDAGSFAYEVEIVAICDGDEGDAEEIVFGDDFTHIQPIVKALDAMHGRAPANLLRGEDAIAAQCEIAGDFGHELRQVVRDGGLVEVPFVEELGGVQAPLCDDFPLTGGEDVGEMRDGAENVSIDSAELCRIRADRYTNAST